MALHGLIAMNGTPIGAWTAVRREKLDDAPHPDTVYTYDCDVEMDSIALGGSRRVKVVVTHRYGDGALALVAKLTTAAARKIPTVA